MKKINIVAACAFLALACSLSSCGDVETSSKDDLSSVRTGVTTTTVMGEKSALKLTGSVSTVKTQAVCTKIEFDNGCVLFANSQGGYTIINDKNEVIDSMEVTDDNGDKLVINCKGGKITLMKNDSEVNSFSYKGTRIIIKDNEVYYADTKVAYADTSFCTFKIDDENTLECISDGKFAVKKNGTKTDKITVTDMNGDKFVIEAMDKGIEITNSDNELMDSIVVNGYFIRVTSDKVIINGKTMTPPGSNDIKTVTTTTSATTVSTTKRTTTTTTVTQPPQTQSPVAEPEPEPELEPEPEPEVPQPEQPSEPDSDTNVENRNISEETAEMLGYVNEVRKQYGLPELSGLELLDEASGIRAEEIADTYSHKRPDGRDYDTVIDEVGLPEWYHIAENIGNGPNCMTTVKEAFDAWMNSEGHRANILNPDMKYMAVAKSTRQVNGDEITYWEQIFYNDR